jgi:hypothetical protein
MPMESVRANIKLAISGGQNEPRDAIAGCIWALLTHPEQLELVRAGKVRWVQVFEEYARWISPIGMSPRRIAKAWSINGIDLEPEDRVFFMFGSANRDEAHFHDAEHRLRRGPALLRGRLGFARHGGRCGVAQRVLTARGFAPRRHGPGAHRRLGLSRPVELACGVEIRHPRPAPRNILTPVPATAATSCRARYQPPRRLTVSIQKAHDDCAQHGRRFYAASKRELEASVSCPRQADESLLNDPFATGSPHRSDTACN